MSYSPRGIPKLTWDKVRAIRAAAEACIGRRVPLVAALAERYGVAPSTIWNVISRGSWPEEPRTRQAPTPIVRCPSNDPEHRRKRDAQLELIEAHIGRPLRSRVAAVAAMLLLCLLPALAAAQTGKSESCETTKPNATVDTLKAGEKRAIGGCFEWPPFAGEWVLRDGGKRDTREDARLIRDEEPAGNGLFFAATRLIDFTPGKHALTIDYVKLAPDSDVVVTAMPVPLVLTVESVTPPAPIDCVVSAWTDWSAWSPWVVISPTLEHRTQMRTRTVTTDAANGGTACPVLVDTDTETRAITVDACAGVVTVAVGDWTRTATAGDSAQVFWSLGRSKEPITAITVYIDDVPAPSTADNPNPKTGEDLRGFTGSRFRVPVGSGTHELSLMAQSKSGCKGVADRLMPLVVR